MRLATEIYTKKVQESKEFFCTFFDFKVKFEAEGFVVLQHRINTAYELLFCIPNSPFVNEIFRPEFKGQGIIFQMEVEDVENEYRRILAARIPIELELIEESINGKHFTIKDPNGIYIDIVQYD